MSPLPSGLYRVDTDGSTLVRYDPYVVDSDDETLLPVDSIIAFRQGLPNPGDPGDPGGPGGDPAKDWRAAPLFDPGPGKVVPGMYVSTSGDTVDSLATLWGAPFNLTRVYTGGGAAGVGNAQTHLNNGRVPVISINWKNELKSYINPNGTAGAARTNVGGTGKTLARFMADGNFDGDPTTGLVNISGGPSNVPGFRKIARAFKALTKGACPTNKVVLTPWHEMENAAESGFGWFKTTTGFADCRAAWQRMRQVFDDEGVTNVLWGICWAAADNPTKGQSLTDTGSTGFYPGHAYVDWVMWDPYNSAGKQDCGGAHGPGYGNAWINLGVNGDRGDGSSNTLLNKFGQMDWWWTYFKMGGAATAAAAVGGQGVYKPVWYGETGTGEFDPDTPSNPATQADIWWDKWIEYLNSMNPGVNQPLRGWIYFNNGYNDLTCTGSHRRAGFIGRGTSNVWAKIEQTG
jgi:hypothetical protein